MSKLLYFDFLNEDIITEIVRYLNYDDLYTVIKDGIIDENFINYNYLFYYKDQELELLIKGENFYINYTSIRDIIKNESIPYKTLYFLQLKKDIYLIDLIIKKYFYMSDINFYNLIIQNKNIIYNYKFEYLDETVYLPHISLVDIYFGILKENLSLEKIANLYYFNNIEEILKYTTDKYRYDPSEYRNFYNVLDNIFRNDNIKNKKIVEIIDIKTRHELF